MKEQQSMPDEQRPAAPWLTINSFDELIKHEKSILDRIEKTPNGANLFMVHPFLLLADIGVQVSEQAKSEILKANPNISGLSRTPYDALKRSTAKQNVNFRLRGLFQRRVQ
jgi:hypothetical protein